MTKDRGIPNRGRATRPSQGGNSDKLPKRPVVPRSRLPVPPPTYPAVSQSNGGTVAPPPRSLESTVPLPNAAPMTPQPTASARNRRQWSWTPTWGFWVVLTLLITGGLGTVSIALLVRSPALPNCPSIFWPMASASMRLYCAQVAANKQTVKDLLEAIDLVHSLPQDHPLRPEINRSIEQWAMDILNLAEGAFNAGRLPEAIETARQIPDDTTAYASVNERIERWQSIWDKAEAIYQKSEAALRERKWHQAFTEAARLLYIGNTYWETTKYQELSERIRTAREDGNKLYKAEELADIGGVDNLVKAIQLAESIGPKSYVYQKAQAAIVKFGRKMLDLAQETLDARNANEAISIARKIPASAKLEAETQDFIDLADAQAQAWQGTIPDLEAAIAQAQKLTANRPLFKKAQQLINRWQNEIEGVAHLERARQLARGGEVSDLAAAVAEASLVLKANPRWDEAQKEIGRWRTQIETIEDQPYLDRAEQYALGGDPISLQAAVDEARQIGSGRALSQQAQEKIRQWTREIQRSEDQPYLDQARSLAISGDLPSAIATAGQIKQGRALYDEAQENIRNWRSRIQAQEDWQAAQGLANSATPDGLSAAIGKASQIPSGDPLYSEATAAIDQWSQSLLVLAQNQANYDLNSAIAIAQKIPSGTDVYGIAQDQIATWRQALKPPEPPAPRALNNQPDFNPPPPSPGN